MTISQALKVPGLIIRERRKLLRAILGYSETDLFLRAERSLSSDAKTRYLEYTSRRLSGEPMAYILGEEDFYHRQFYVSEAVLIPRPETEMLIELAKEVQPKTVLDLCTGSGILAITLQKELGAAVVASDVSDQALIVARRNADRHRTSITLIQGDLFEHVVGTFDLIVSNPPYIDSDVLRELEVARFEPTLALDGGAGGLSIYRRLIAEASDYLVDHGVLLLEIGYDQAEQIQTMLQAAGFRSIEIFQDLAGFDRVVKAVRRKK